MIAKKKKTRSYDHRIEDLYNTVEDASEFVSKMRDDVSGKKKKSNES